jgi:hypothetical protein
MSLCVTNGYPAYRGVKTFTTRERDVPQSGCAGGFLLSLSLIHATQQVDCFATRLLCLDPPAPGSI